jgi:ferredoxin-NADP reductase
MAQVRLSRGGKIPKMSAHTVKLKNRREVAEGTMAFHLEKPANFTFKPGQFIELALIDPPETDGEGNVRPFSIASAPHEPDLMVTTRMRDTAFKRTLKTLPIGSTVAVEGPFGNLTLHNNAARPAVFLAGGIGITPFRSIIHFAAKEKLPHRLYLFYSNRRPEDAAFLEELQKIEKENRNYKFIGTMTEMGKSKQSWKGETGFMDGKMLAGAIPDLTAPIYYIAGPPAMVAAMQDMLVAAGVDSDNVRIEEFSGY